MNWFIKAVIFISIFVFIQLKLIGQPYNGLADLQIGKPGPDIILKNIEHFKSSQKSLRDFRGKWLILDFWSSGCASCVASFPGLNQMQKTYADKVQIILLGRDDKWIRPMYEKFRVRQNLELPIIFDTILFKYFDVFKVPYTIILDEKGICRAITSALTENNLTDLMDGKNPVLFKAMTKKQEDSTEKDFDFDKPLLIGGNAGGDYDFSYRSVLFPWKSGITSIDMEFGDHVGNMMQFTGVPLFKLYAFAYGDTVTNIPIPYRRNSYETWYGHPKLELKDSSEFEYDYKLEKNIFCYSETVPPLKASNKFLQESMQRDLQTYFGYDVKIEDRMVACWNLVVTDIAAAKLKTKGAKTEIISDDRDGQAGKKFVNVPVSYIIYDIWYYHQTDLPFFDATGIVGNIDLNLDSIMTDLNAIKEALNKSGLDLVKSEKKMKVIVIRDPIK